MATAVAELETISPRADQPLAQGLPLAAFHPALQYLDYFAGGAASWYWRSQLPTHVTLEPVDS
jgi:hypothetical protein